MQYGLWVRTSIFISLRCLLGLHRCCAGCKLNDLIGTIKLVIRLRPISRLLMKSGHSVGWFLLLMNSIRLLVSSGQSVEAQRSAECCQQHRLVEAWLERRPLAGKPALAG